MNQKVCPNCQSSFASDELNFCLHCGTRLNTIFADALPAEIPRRSSAKSSLILPAVILIGILLVGILATAAIIGVYFSQKTEQAVINEPKSDTLPKKETLNVTPTKEISNKTSPFGGTPNQTPESKLNAFPNVEVSATSFRKPDKGNTYQPGKAFDGDLKTAWCEGGKGAGIGESLSFNFDRKVKLSDLTIHGGYFKSSETWTKNNRVAEAELEFSAGKTKRVKFPNTSDALKISLAGIETDYVKITILSIYSGASDAEDTLISEVSFNLQN